MKFQHVTTKLRCWWLFFFAITSFGCSASYPWLNRLVSAAIPDDIAHNSTGLVLLDNDARIELTSVQYEGESWPQATLIWRRQLRVVSLAAFAHSAWIQLLDVDDKQNHATVLAAAVRIKHSSGKEQVIEKSSPDNILKLPALAVGDLIDIYMKRHYPTAWALPPWAFASSVPTLHASLTVQAPTSLHVQVALQDERVLPQESGDRENHLQTWHIDQYNLPKVVDQTQVGLGAGLITSYNPGPMAVMSLSVVPHAVTSWTTLAHWLNSWLQPSIEVGADQHLALEEDVLTKNLTRIARMLRVDHKAFILAERPRSFTKLYAEGANSLEAAAIAAKLSTDRGEPAYIALVAPITGPQVVRTLPGLYAFQTALVAWPGPHGWVFADPTCLTCETGQLSFTSAGGTAWIVDDQQTTWATVPLYLAETNEQNLKFTWKYAAEESLHGEVLAELRGSSVERVTESLSPGKNAVWHEEIRRQMLLPQEANILNSLDLPEDLQDHPTDEPTHSMVLRFMTQAVHFKLPQVKKSTPLKPVDIAGAGFFWSLPKPTEKTKQDWLLPGPLRVSTMATVVGPKAFVVPNIDKPMHVQSRFGSYRAHFSIDQGVLLYERQVILTVRRVAAADLPDLHAFAHAIHELEAQKWELYVGDE